MSSYKLTYFNFRGRAELIRWLFVLGDQAFDEVRLERWGEPWAKMKPDSLFGIVPELEVDGVTLCQSKAIARFLANRFGLAGKNDVEKAQVDMIADCTDDMSRDIVKIHYLYHWKKTEEADAMKKNYLEDNLPAHLTYLERMLKSNNGGDGYFVGDGLTWADLILVDALHHWFLSCLSVDVDLSAHPKLEALTHRVLNLPKLAQWRAKTA